MHIFSKGARVVQWWERLPPTNVARVRILASTPCVGWVCCWFSPLLREVFLRVLQFSPLLKNQHFEIPIRSGTHGHVSTSYYELLSDLWVNKLQFTILLMIFWLVKTCQLWAPLYIQFIGLPKHFLGEQPWSTCIKKMKLFKNFQLFKSGLHPLI